MEIKPKPERVRMSSFEFNGQKIILKKEPLTPMSRGLGEERKTIEDDKGGEAMPPGDGGRFEVRFKDRKKPPLPRAAGGGGRGPKSLKMGGGGKGGAHCRSSSNMKKGVSLDRKRTSVERGKGSVERRLPALL